MLKNISLFKKMMNKGGREPNAFYIVHDLSVDPIWDPADEFQQQRVRVWFEKEIQAYEGKAPEIYYYHGGKGILVKP